MRYLRKQGIPEQELFWKNHSKMNSSSYIIAIRTDGSNAIGMGHISTCLALAERLKQYKEINVYFMMKQFPEAVSKVTQAGYRVRTINVSLSEQEIVREVLRIVKEEKTDLLLTDLLEINSDFSQQLRELGIKSISVDILGKIKLQSDIIINRTFIKERYKNYNSNNISKFFLGPEYVVLNKQYRGIEHLQRMIGKEVKNILVFLGGGDEFNITTRAAKILDSILHLEITIVLGAAFKGDQELRHFLKTAKNRFTVQRDVENFSEHLLQTDLAICAGGLTLYELAITGTPALIIPMNEHQVENAQGFQEKGSVLDAGLHTKITDEEIKQKIIMLMKDWQKRKEMSTTGKKITDGRGAELIGSIIYNHLRT